MAGTILDPRQDLPDALNHTLRAHGYPQHSVSEVMFMVGNGIHKLIERAVPEGTKKEELERVFEAYLPYYEEHCADATKPYQGIVPAILRLRELGIMTAVVSNKKDSAVQELCEIYFKGCFQAAVGERDGVKRKPAPDSVNEVLKTLGIRKEEAVYIGDSDVDLQTAENAGMDVIAVTWGFRSKQFLKEHGARVFADTPEDLVALIRTDAHGFV
ncbi:MAG: HAD family hydrolase [Lachnospiraceae bacterium]|nr:HAD family hydrolase [Lachnospiraceae bacterium]